MSTPNELDETLSIRPVKETDIPSLIVVYYHAFNAPFFRHFTPDTPALRRWWHASWQLSLANPNDRNFAVEELATGKIVAFSRWMLPQDDGNTERPWPDLDEKDWDMEIAEPFFGGMERNHVELMGKRKHWCKFLASSF